ncbi:MAG: sigma-70 family RNA polymerase sigma factor [Planctomycetes bacterium]|nr:sigma-70 family RNA polymerase sigma factor [Planctomycetota bacterium]
MERDVRARGDAVRAALPAPRDALRRAAHGGAGGDEGPGDGHRARGPRVVRGGRRRARAALDRGLLARPARRVRVARRARRGPARRARRVPRVRGAHRGRARRSESSRGHAALRRGLRDAPAGQGRAARARAPARSGTDTGERARAAQEGEPGGRARPRARRDVRRARRRRAERAPAADGAARAPSERARGRARRGDDVERPARRFRVRVQRLRRALRHRRRPAHAVDRRPEGRERGAAHRRAAAAARAAPAHRAAAARAADACAPRRAAGGRRRAQRRARAEDRARSERRRARPREVDRGPRDRGADGREASRRSSVRDRRGRARDALKLAEARHRAILARLQAGAGARRRLEAVEHAEVREIGRTEPSAARSPAVSAASRFRTPRTVPLERPAPGTPFPKTCNRDGAAGVLPRPAQSPAQSVPEPDTDLDACLERVLAGDPEASRALIALCHPLVRRIVRAYRPRSVTVEDLTQDVFIKMFAHLHHYEPRAEKAFEPWVARIAVNTCKDALRGEARRSASIPISEAAAPWLEFLATEREPAVEDELGARELVDVLFAELPPEDRLVLTLVDLEGRSSAEVAALTGWSRALVKVRAFRARLRLRAVAARRGEGLRG